MTLDCLVSHCRERGMRRTPALDGLLEVLMKADRPLSLGTLHQNVLRGRSCDRATVYRLLLRLEESGIVRRLGLRERASFYVLLRPGTHQDYLICTICGVIEPVSIECPVHTLEKQVAKDSGFSEVYHELEFYGVCPECQTEKNRPVRAASENCG